MRYILNKIMLTVLSISAAGIFFAATTAANDAHYQLGSYITRHSAEWSVWLGFELCADDLNNLELEMGPQDATWWEQVQYRETGKRMKTTGGFIMKFSRPIGEEEECEASGRRSGLPRCLVIDPDRVARQLTLVGQVPYYDDKLVDCNAPEVVNLSDLSELDIREHRVPLRTSSFLGIADQVISYFGEPLKKDCEYKIRLGHGPFTEEGRCLPEAKEIPFVVVGDERSPFERETLQRRYDPTNFQILAFTVKDDVTVYRDEMWNRYGPDIGIGRYLGGVVNVNNMLPLEDGEAVESHAAPGEVNTYYRQMYGQLPVEGAGAVVREMNGLVKSVVGRIVGGLKLHFDWGNEISESQAFNEALAAVAANIYAWDWDPENFEEPTGELVWFSSDFSMEPESFVAAWRFRIDAYEPMSSQLVFIDAFSGDLLAKLSAVQDAGYPEGFSRDPDQWAWWKNVSSSGVIEYEGIRDDFRVTQVNMAPPPDTTLIRPDDDKFFYLLLDQGPPVIEVFRFFIQGRTTSNATETVIDDEIAFEDHETIQSVGGEPGVDYETGYNVFDAADQTAEVTVYRSLLLMIEYLKELLGEERAANLFQGPRGIDHINAYVSAEPLREDAPLAAYIPKGVLVKDDPVLYFYKAKPGYGPGVTHDLVGHEFFHQLVNDLNPFLPSSIRLTAPLEGFADAFGTLFEFFVREKMQDPRMGEGDWCMYAEAKPGECPWLLSDPKAMGFTNSFFSEQFEANVAACADQEQCVRKLTQLLTSYAIYLMIHGSGEGGTTLSGEAGFKLNDKGCFYKVDPLHPDPKIARDIAARLLWFVVTEQIGAKFGIYTAREALIKAAEVAQVLFQEVPSTAAETVTDAFYAIGIGNHFEPANFEFKPYLNKPDEEPWPAELKWDVPLGTDWEVQVATDQDFTENLQTHNVGRFETDPGKTAQNLWTANPLLDLLPKKRYYWRYRQPIEAPWDQCADIRYFLTASKAPRVSKPQGAPALGGGERARTTFPWGAEIAGPPVEGASEYFIKVSESPESGCEPEGGPHEAVDADTAKNGFEATFELVAERDYYVYARAFGPAPEKLPGDCSNGGQGIKIRTRKASAPLQRSPVEGDWSNRYGSGQTHYDWSPIQGADDYRLRIFRQSDTGGAGDLVREVPTGKVDELTVSGEEITNSHTGYCWTIQAIGKEGDEGEESLDRCYELAPDRPEIVGSGGTSVDSVALAWTSEHAPFGYYVQVFAGSNPIFDGEVHDTTLTLTGLNYNQTYTWHVWAREHDGARPEETHASAEFTTEPAPAPEEDEVRQSTGQCDTQMIAGGNWIDERTFNLGRDSGYLAIDYTTYTVPDKITILYEGEEIWTSGCVGTGGDVGTAVWRNAYSIYFSGQSEQIIVRVEPGCSTAAGPTDNTEWIYFVYCPG